jgi:tRNA A37 threonylcarbamoyladenosine biosynthesis protein TsaE
MTQPSLHEAAAMLRSNLEFGDVYGIDEAGFREWPVDTLCYFSNSPIFYSNFGMLDTSDYNHVDLAESTYEWWGMTVKDLVTFLNCPFMQWSWYCEPAVDTNWQLGGRAAGNNCPEAQLQLDIALANKLLNRGITFLPDKPNSEHDADVIPESDDGRDDDDQNTEEPQRDGESEPELAPTRESNDQHRTATVNAPTSSADGTTQAGTASTLQSTNVAPGDQTPAIDATVVETPTTLGENTGQREQSYVDLNNLLGQLTSRGYKIYSHFAIRTNLDYKALATACIDAWERTAEGVQPYVNPLTEAGVLKHNRTPDNTMVQAPAPVLLHVLRMMLTGDELQALTQSLQNRTITIHISAYCNAQCKRVTSGNTIEDFATMTTMTFTLFNKPYPITASKERTTLAPITNPEPKAVHPWLWPRQYNPCQPLWITGPWKAQPKVTFDPVVTRGCALECLMYCVQERTFEPRLKPSIKTTVNAPAFASNEDIIEMWVTLGFNLVLVRGTWAHYVRINDGPVDVVRVVHAGDNEHLLVDSTGSDHERVMGLMPQAKPQGHDSIGMQGATSDIASEFAKTQSHSDAEPASVTQASIAKHLNKFMIALSNGGPVPEPLSAYYNNCIARLTHDYSMVTRLIGRWKTGQWAADASGGYATTAVQPNRVILVHGNEGLVPAVTYTLGRMVGIYCPHNYLPGLVLDIGLAYRKQGRTFRRVKSHVIGILNTSTFLWARENEPGRAAVPINLDADQLYVADYDGMNHHGRPERDSFVKHMENKTLVLPKNVVLTDEITEALHSDGPIRLGLSSGNWALFVAADSLEITKSIGATINQEAVNFSVHDLCNISRDSKQWNWRQVGNRLRPGTTDLTALHDTTLGGGVILQTAPSYMTAEHPLNPKVRYKIHVAAGILSVQQGWVGDTFNDCSAYATITFTAADDPPNAYQHTELFGSFDNFATKTLELAKHAKPGQVIAYGAPSGAGKTSVAKLSSALIDHEQIINPEWWTIKNTRQWTEAEMDEYIRNNTPHKTRYNGSILLTWRASTCPEWAQWAGDVAEWANKNIGSTQPHGRHVSSPKEQSHDHSKHVTIDDLTAGDSLVIGTKKDPWKSQPVEPMILTDERISVMKSVEGLNSLTIVDWQPTTTDGTTEPDKLWTITGSGTYSDDFNEQPFLDVTAPNIINYWEDETAMVDTTITLPRNDIRLRGGEHFNGIKEVKKTTMVQYPTNSQPNYVQREHCGLQAVADLFGSVLKLRAVEHDPELDADLFIETYAKKNSIKSLPLIQINYDDMMEWLRQRPGNTKIAAEVDQILSEGIDIHGLDRVNVHRKIERRLKDVILGALDEIGMPETIEEQRVRLIVWQQKGITALFAPVFLKAKEHLKRILVDNVIYADGLTPAQLSAILNTIPGTNITFAEDDLKKQDRQTDATLIATEMAIYRRLGVGCTKTWELVHRKWRAKGMGYLFEGDASRQTGQCTTAIGNVIVNLLVKMKLVKLLGPTLKMMLVLGDDNIILTTGEITERMISEHSARHFNMRSEPVVRTDHGTFLRMIAYVNSNGVLELGPDVIRLRRGYEVTNGVHDSTDNNLVMRAMSYCCMLGNLKGVRAIIEEKDWPIRPDMWYEWHSLAEATAKKYKCTVEEVHNELNKLLTTIREERLYTYSKTMFTSKMM